MTSLKSNEVWYNDGTGAPDSTAGTPGDLGSDSTGTLYAKTPGSGWTAQGGSSGQTPESTDGSVRITNPSGPTPDFGVVLSSVDCQFPVGPTGSPYQSLQANQNFLSSSGGAGTGTGTGQAGNFVTTLTTAPMTIPPGDIVLGTEGAPNLYFSVNDVDTTGDDLRMACVLTITDLTGDNVLQITGTTDIPQSGPNQTGSIDFTGATVNVIAGTDLVWDATVATLTSTAGGVYVVCATCIADWD